MSDELALATSSVLQLPDPATWGITFSASNAVVLTITHDGRIERGPGLKSDDEATVAFVDCLAAYMPGFIGELRGRAERAERELADLRRRLAGLPFALTDR